MANTDPKDMDKLDRILNSLDFVGTKIEKMDGKHDALTSRLNAVEAVMVTMNEKSAKEKKDAVTKENDAKRADAAAALAATGTLDDKAQFSAAQMRADAAYQSWSKQAPPGLHGETLRDFRIRLLNPLKKHSKTYCDSALALIGDDNAFSTVEAAIIADAISASNTSFDSAAPLRKVVRKDDSGHVVTRWIGDPSVWMATHMGGATRFGRLNRHPNSP